MLKKYYSCLTQRCEIPTPTEFEERPEHSLISRTDTARYGMCGRKNRHIIFVFRVYTRIAKHTYGGIKMIIVYLTLYPHLTHVTHLSPLQLQLTTGPRILYTVRFQHLSNFLFKAIFRFSCVPTYSIFLHLHL